MLSSRTFLRRVLLGALFGVAALLPASAQNSPVPAQAAQAERCKVGIYIIDLHEFDVQKKLFDADLWVWSQCANAQRLPLKTMDFTNANHTVATLDTTLPRNDLFWSVRRIDGTFRHQWDVRAFPFDRHVLEIVMEEGIDDTRAFQYDPDLSQSGYDNRIEVPGWKIDGFKLVPATRTYHTTFGDPSLAPDAQAHYSRLRAEISLSRASYTAFFKIAAVVYVAAALALLSFLFHLDSPNSFGPRISLLAGSLFASVINMRVSSTELGSNDGLTLIDMIHITCLVLVLTATVMTVVADRRLGTRKAKTIRQFDLRNLAVCSIAFVASNIALLAIAIYG